jgi:hypothetical protein
MTRWLSLAAVLATAGMAQGGVVGKFVSLGPNGFVFMSCMGAKPELLELEPCDELMKGGKGDLPNTRYKLKLDALKPGVLIELCISMEKKNGRRTIKGIAPATENSFNERDKYKAKWPVPQ